MPRELRAIKLAFFCSYLFLVESGVAQTQVSFKRYDVLDGLSHNAVRETMQDSTGFVWVATDNGLNKFDGYSFKKYFHVPRNDSITTNHPIKVLEEDQEFNIWIGTWGGGIYVYDYWNDQFQSIVETSDASRLDFNFVYDLYYDDQGRMWAGTVGGLAQINTEDYSFTYYQHDPTDSTSLSNNRAIAISADQEGNLWVGTLGGGLNHFNLDSETFTHFRHRSGDPASLSQDDVYSVLCDAQQRIWVGTWDGGLNLMEDPDKGFVHFYHQPDNSTSLANNQVWSIAEGQQGNIWVGTDNGLCLFQEPERTFVVYRNDPFDVKSLSSNSIKSLDVDNQNRLWVGTYDGGINLYDPQTNRIQHYYQRQNQQSISSNNATAFLELNREQVLVGTDGGGLNLLNRSSGEVTQFIHDPNNPSSIGSDKVKALLLDRQQRIWIGFWNGGMDYFDTDNQTFTHYREKEGNGLASDNVTCLAEDQEGVIWLGTFGGGLQSYDPANNRFTTYTQSPDDEEGLSDKNIWTVLVDRQNNIWVGTSNGRVDMLDRQQNRFIRMLPRPNDNRGYTVLTLFEDQAGKIWAGLDGGGLRLLDQQNNSYEQYTTTEELPSNTINTIEEDASGNLWVSTNYGLARFNPVSKKCDRFTVSDGLQGLHFNRQASIQLSSGELFFGGTNGFNIFYPDSLGDISLNAPIAFTNFEIFNQQVPVGADGSPLEVDINYQESITLSHEQSVFTLSYASINFTNPKQVRYQYRLLGFIDDTWQDAGTDRKVTYTNLNPGQYVFEVIARVGGVTTPLRQLAITVTPPWWRTWWFYVITGLAFVSLLYAIFWLRSQHIIRTNRRLEAEVVERTRKMQEANQELHQKNSLIQDQKEEIQTQAEELIASNEEIRSINQRLEDTVEIRTADLRKSNEELDNFVYRVSHDIRAPLSSVLGLLELMGLEESVEQQNAYREMAFKSINKLDGFVKNILDYSRNSRLQTQNKQIDFHQLLDDLLEDLQYMKNAQRLRIIREIDDKKIYYSDPMRLQVVLRNLLSNAIKYQSPYVANPFVKVQVVIKPTETIITVEDNGIGIREEQVQHVFEMFYRADDQASGSGIGLYIVKETIDKLGGTITLSSQSGTGTIFGVKLPNHFVERER
ncbi:sensor histidine kinase [Tunicatimonas pelagia]|uniref:sensor histidine kinase n=1 Tax=Tunicatimonas pelagia TaxID=931531 RepID=UPI00266581C2|nr:sensor histidine kinase [Tunicatimonas pelagia]WKN42403.1 two-component regulator propeller domain-containing protein [Tunicatimonas pelagia]